MGSKLDLLKFLIKYDKDFRCLNTKGEYCKVKNTEIKWSIISKSVMIVIFVEFINQLIDILINRASLSVYDAFIFNILATACILIRIDFVASKHTLWVLTEIATSR